MFMFLVAMLIPQCQPTPCFLCAIGLSPFPLKLQRHFGRTSSSAVFAWPLHQIPSPHPPPPLSLISSTSSSISSFALYLGSLITKPTLVHCLLTSSSLLIPLFFLPEPLFLFILNWNQYARSLIAYQPAQQSSLILCSNRSINQKLPLPANSIQVPVQSKQIFRVFEQIHTLLSELFPRLSPIPLSLSILGFISTLIYTKYSVYILNILQTHHLR